jgi:hypothetical protein
MHGTAAVHRRALVSTLLACASVAAACFPEALAADALPAAPGFELQASNGYELSAFGLRPAGARPSEVVVLLSRGGSSAYYVAGGRVTPTSFEADFGALGRVAVTYRPTGGQIDAASSCEPPFSFPTGVYEGAIEFHGEGGYADVSADAAAGAATSGVTCGLRSEASGGRIAGARLSVSSGGLEGGFHLEVHRNGPHQPSVCRVESLESSGDVAIVRTACARGPASSFQFSTSLRSATLRPPAPFAGAGSFRRPGKGAGVGRGGRWGGNLSVDLPGSPDTPLDDPLARAMLIRARVTEDLLSRAGTLAPRFRRVAVAKAVRAATDRHDAPAPAS